LIGMGSMVTGRADAVAGQPIAEAASYFLCS
jgi:hypothetical protein